MRSDVSPPFAISADVTIYNGSVHGGTSATASHDTWQTLSNERKRWSPQRFFSFLVNRCALRFWQIRPPLGKSAHGIYSKRVVAMWGFIWIYFFLVHQDGATERFGREMRMKLHGASRWLQNRPKTTPPQNHHFDPCDGHNLAF